MQLLPGPRSLLLHFGTRNAYHELLFGSGTDCPFGCHGYLQWSLMCPQHRKLGYDQYNMTVPGVADIIDGVDSKAAPIVSMGKSSFAVRCT